MKASARYDWMVVTVKAGAVVRGVKYFQADDLRVSSELGKFLIQEGDATMKTKKTKKTTYTVAAQFTSGNMIVAVDISSIVKAKRVARNYFVAHKPLSIEVAGGSYYSEASQLHGAGMLWTN